MSTYTVKDYYTETGTYDHFKQDATYEVSDDDVYHYVVQMVSLNEGSYNDNIRFGFGMYISMKSSSITIDNESAMVTLKITYNSGYTTTYTSYVTLNTTSSVPRAALCGCTINSSTGIPTFNPDSCLILDIPFYESTNSLPIAVTYTVTPADSSSSFFKKIIKGLESENYGHSFTLPKPEYKPIELYFTGTSAAYIGGTARYLLKEYGAATKFNVDYTDGSSSYRGVTQGSYSGSFTWNYNMVYDFPYDQYATIRATATPYNYYGELMSQATSDEETTDLQVWAPPDCSISSVVEYNQNLGKFVDKAYIQGYSSFQVSFNAYAGTGANLNEVTVTVTDPNGNEKTYDGTDQDYIVTDTVTVAGTYKFAVSCKDSRGNTDESTWGSTKTVVAYESPTSTFRAYRMNASGEEVDDDTGIYIGYDVSWKFTPITVSSSVYNSCYVDVYESTRGHHLLGNTTSEPYGINITPSSSYGYTGSLTAQRYTGDTYDVLTNYPVQLNIQDDIAGTVVPKRDPITTKNTFISLNKNGKSMGLGQTSTADKEGYLEIGYDETVFNKNVTFQNLASIKIGTSSLLDLLYPVGSIKLTYTNTNPSTSLGGTWKLYGSGNYLMSANSSDSAGAHDTSCGSVTLSESNMPKHSHTITHTHSISHTHNYSSTSSASGTISFSGYVPYNTTETWSGDTVASDISGKGYKVAHTLDGGTVGSFNSIKFTGSLSGSTGDPSSANTGAASASTTGDKGSGTAFTVTPNYYKVFVWQRTA